MRATKQGSPYMAPGARRMAEGGSAKPKRKVLLRKDGKKTEMSGRKADKIRKGVKEGKDKIRTGFLGLGKTYKVVQEEKAKAKTKSSGGGSKPTRPKARPAQPSKRLDSKGETPKKKTDPRSNVKVTKRDLGRNKKDPRSDVKVTKRDLGRGKSTRATQSDRKEYRRADEMRGVTRGTGATSRSLATRMGKGNKPGASAARQKDGAYSEYNLRKRAGGAEKFKTRGGTSKVDVDKIKTYIGGGGGTSRKRSSTGSGSRKTSGNRGS